MSPLTKSLIEELEHAPETTPGGSRACSTHMCPCGTSSRSAT